MTDKIEIWVENETGGKDGAIKMKLDVEDHVTDLVSACVSVFAFGPSGISYKASQLQILDSDMKVLSNRSPIQEVVTSGDTVHIRPRPGTYTTEKRSAVAHSTPNNHHNQITQGNSHAGHSSSNHPRYMNPTSKGEGSFEWSSAQQFGPRTNRSSSPAREGSLSPSASSPAVGPPAVAMKVTASAAARSKNKKEPQAVPSPQVTPRPRWATSSSSIPASLLHSKKAPLSRSRTHEPPAAPTPSKENTQPHSKPALPRVATVTTERKPASSVPAPKKPSPKRAEPKAAPKKSESTARKAASKPTPKPAVEAPVVPLESDDKPDISAVETPTKVEEEIKQDEEPVVKQENEIDMSAATTVTAPENTVPPPVIEQQEPVFATPVQETNEIDAGSPSPPPPEDEDSDPVPESPEEREVWLQKFTSFYEIHCPQKVAGVPALIDKKGGFLQELWDMLLTKYELTEETWNTKAEPEEAVATVEPVASEEPQQVVEEQVVEEAAPVEPAPVEEAAPESTPVEEAAPEPMPVEEAAPEPVVEEQLLKEESVTEQQSQPEASDVPLPVPEVPCETPRPVFGEDQSFDDEY